MKTAVKFIHPHIDIVDVTQTKTKEDMISYNSDLHCGPILFFGAVRPNQENIDFYERLLDICDNLFNPRIVLLRNINSHIEKDSTRRHGTNSFIKTE